MHEKARHLQKILQIVYNKTTWNVLCEGAVDGYLSDLDGIQ